jgi:hypothetical protein
MMNYELAINEDGEPFAVPPEVAGWRPRRASDGRGRPALVHTRGTGKPLILPVDASHADLLAAAGPGRYRCEAVDAEHRRIDGIPVACTGPLTADGTSGDDELREEPSTGKSHLEAVIYQMGQMAMANTRLAEKSVEQMGIIMGGVSQIGAVMSGAAEMFRAACSGGAIIHPPPPPSPAAPIVVEVEDPDDDEQDDDGADESDEDGASNAASATTAASGVSEVVQFIIKETIAKVVPMIFEKLGSSGGVAGIAGIPLEALLDWRKAAPQATPINVQSPPSASVAPPSATVASSPPSAPMTSPIATTPAVPASAPVASSPPSAPMTSPIASTPVANPAVTATPTYAGAAPGGAPPGAVPAGMDTPPATSSPETPEDAAALLDAHIRRIWQGLSPSERTRAGGLLAQLPSEARTEVLAELVRLSVPEAIARARALIDATPPS